MMGLMPAGETFGDEIWEEILERISNGETLTSICKAEGFPAVRTVSAKCCSDEDYNARFARARADGFDALASECLEIANSPVIGETITSKEWGEEVKREDMLGHRKLMIDTRLKLLAKWDPKRYGERIQQESDSETKLADSIGALVEKLPQ